MGVTRSSGLANTILQGTVQGGRRRGRQRKRWEDYIKDWTGLEWNIILQKAENREEWRKLIVKSTVVHQPSARLRDIQERPFHAFSVVKYLFMLLVNSFYGRTPFHALHHFCLFHYLSQLRTHRVTCAPTFKHLPLVLQFKFKSQSGLEFSIFTIWHFLEHVVRVFLQILLFPCLLHWLMASTDEIFPWT